MLVVLILFFILLCVLAGIGGAVVHGMAWLFILCVFFAIIAAVIWWTGPRSSARSRR